MGGGGVRYYDCISKQGSGSILKLLPERGRLRSNSGKVYLLFLITPPIFSKQTFPSAFPPRMRLHIPFILFFGGGGGVGVEGGVEGAFGTMIQKKSTSEGES